MQKQLDIDDLFKKRVEREEMRIAIQETILERIHSRIKMMSRLQGGMTFTMQLVPEIMLGQPMQNVEQCISQVVTSLTKNGFRVRQTHPNLLLISWEHLSEQQKITDKTIQDEQKAIVESVQKQQKMLQLQNVKKQLEEERRMNDLVGNTRVREEDSRNKKRGLPTDTFLRSTEDYVASDKLKSIFYNKNK